MYLKVCQTQKLSQEVNYDPFFLQNRGFNKGRYSFVAATGTPIIASRGLD